MLIKKFSCLIAGFFAWMMCGNILFAQNNYQEIHDVHVTQGSDLLRFPWMGGFNNPQFGKIDLNKDGNDDMVVFDRACNTVSTFLYVGPVSSFKYIYAPQYESFFPALSNYMILYDYDCDGIKDIFTANGAYVKIYKGSYTGSSYSFIKVTDTLNYEDNGQIHPLFVNPIDIPGIADVNNDGDPDILNFAPGGGYMEYFENRSVENTGSCGQLSFELVDACWGNFYESGLTKQVDLDSCGGNFQSGGIEKERHSGSTVMIFDSNGDGLKEVVLGDISFDNLNLLINGGTLSDANIISQDTAFPSAFTADMPSFPAAFYLDIDGDGTKDLLIAPNAINNSLDVQNIWNYRNTGTTSNPLFSFIKKNFLVDNAIDVGTGSTPTLFDYNNDGLLDLIIGNESIQSGASELSARLTLYENIGTIDTPSFQFITDDFANLSQYNLFAIKPTFGDLDNDGDRDMIIGTFDGYLHYFENKATTGNPASFPQITPQYFNIDVGSFSTPQLLDINRDGKLDLVVGEKNGNLNYFANSGTATSAIFSAIPTDDFFGKVDVRPFFTVVGYSIPYIFEKNGAYEMFVGNINGNIYHYTDIENNLSGIFTLADTLFAGIDVGERAAISGGTLNNNAAQELIIGNLRGGVQLYSQDLFVSINDIDHNSRQYFIFPNPASSFFTLKNEDLPEDAMINIIDISGKILQIHKWEKGSSSIKVEISDLAMGIYFVNIISEDKKEVFKIIKIN